MVNANNMPIFNSDMTILLKLCSSLQFLMFFDQKIRAVKKKCPYVLAAGLFKYV